MARRYSRIREAGQLNIALTNYIQYLTQPRERNVGTRGARPDSKAVYVVPFGFDLPATTERVRVRNSVDGYTDLAARINVAGTGGKVADALGSNTVAQVGQFSPARLVWFRNATRSTSVVRSDITNLEYLKYAGDRSSCAFGRENADDNEYDAFDAIKSSILATSGLAINRVSLSRERYSYS
jgi:hypothetical protein